MNTGAVVMEAQKIPFNQAKLKLMVMFALLALVLLTPSLC
jgi:hypothetical protein